MIFAFGIRGSEKGLDFQNKRTIMATTNGMSPRDCAFDGNLKSAVIGGERRNEKGIGFQNNKGTFSRITKKNSQLGRVFVESRSQEWRFYQCKLFVNKYSN